MKTYPGRYPHGRAALSVLLALALGACAHTPPAAAPQHAVAAPKAVLVVTDPDALESCRTTTMALAGAAGDTAAPTGNAVKLLSVSPPEGRAVGSATVMIADVSYGTREFVSGQTRLAVQFEPAAGSGRDEAVGGSFPALKDSTGTVRFCVPLSRPLNDANLKKPLTLHFVLLKGAAQGPEVVIARSAAFSSATAP
jgi:hypothetical protein